MRSDDPKEPTTNLILEQLPRSEYKRIRPHLEHVPLDLGAVLFEGGEERDVAYFPTKGIVSVIEILAEGESSEVALIGSDGLVGITTVLGGQRQPNRVLVQSAGAAFRIPASVLREEFRRGGVLMDLILLYIQILYTQVARTAVCNRHHNLHQQLCRWLLLSLDRIRSNELAMTQELIADMLGVRREGVTRAAKALQRQRVIEYSRGNIKVIDRPRLEALCCECYGTLAKETRRLREIQKKIRTAN